MNRSSPPRLLEITVALFQSKFATSAKSRLRSSKVSRRLASSHSYSPFIVLWIARAIHPRLARTRFVIARSGATRSSGREDTGPKRRDYAATGRRIATLEDERARADTAEAELAAERARVRELEALLRQQNP